MPVLFINQGHPKLRIPAKALAPEDLKSPETTRIVAEMTQVFSSKLTPVVGLAAPQIGHLVRLIGYKVTDKQLLAEHAIPEPIQLRFIANPELSIVKGGGPPQYEFCESIPSYSGLVRRASHVRLTGLDLNGTKIDELHSGIVARILQHEVDHLNAVLFTDKMESQTLRHDDYVGKYEVYRK